MSDHPRFSASTTAYRPSSDATLAAVHFQAGPTSLRHPILIVSEHVDDPAAVARKVAAILNQHWSDPT